jgi:Cu/Ag efflux pump CusA
MKQAGLIFTAIPLSAIGGVFALWLRGMPFSISAGIGFIALVRNSCFKRNCANFLFQPT